MSEGLLDILRPPGEPTGRIYGVVSASVADIADPEGLGRVRLLFAWLSMQTVSGWARIAVPMAAGGVGVAFQPAVDDEVLVAFEQGDIRFPYVIGFLWGRLRPPPPRGDGDESVEQVIKSRSGHVIRLVDTPEQGSIEIADSSGQLQIVLDTEKDQVTITAGTIVIAAEEQLVLRGQQIEIQASVSANLRSEAELAVEADGPLSLRGVTVDIN
jgi:uncharacterized protein involved in type VI secretion and phage assembly